jgi:hypothetical protein
VSTWRLWDGVEKRVECRKKEEGFKVRLKDRFEDRRTWPREEMITDSRIPPLLQERLHGEKITQ